jgi:hypothetical protein
MRIMPSLLAKLAYPRNGSIPVMPTNFHESYAGGEIKPPSERSTGLVFGAMAAIVAVLWRHSPTVP